METLSKVPTNLQKELQRDLEVALTEDLCGGFYKGDDGGREVIARGAIYYNIYFGHGLLYGGGV